MSTITKSREATADRRHEIATAARALIVEKGFEGLRTRDIADRVGINIATLHYHVPSKEALIQLVADSARDEFIAQYRSTPQEGMTGAERLRAEFDEFVDTFENHAELLDVMCEFDQRARRDPAVKAIFDRLRGKWLGIVVNILSFGVRDGSFRDDLDPAVAGAMIIATLTGATRIAGTGAPLIRSICAELERSVRNPDKISSAGQSNRPAAARHRGEPESRKE
jgi:AcrR family transcriptional regulator